MRLGPHGQGLLPIGLGFERLCVHDYFAYGPEGAFDDDPVVQEAIQEETWDKSIIDPTRPDQWYHAHRCGRPSALVASERRR